MSSAIKGAINKIFAGRNFDAKRSYKLIRAAVAVWFVAWSLGALSVIIGNPQYNWFGECPKVYSKGGRIFPSGWYADNTCLGAKDRAVGYMIIAIIPPVLFLGLRFGAPRVFDYFFPKKAPTNSTPKTKSVNWLRVIITVITVIIIFYIALEFLLYFYYV